jgi:hypothetical protein
VLPKSLLGLYIPFERQKIVLGYLPFPLTAYGALSLVIGLLFGLGITGMLVLFASASIAYAAELLLPLMKGSKVNKAVRLLLNALLFSGTYLAPGIFQGGNQPGCALKCSEPAFLQGVCRYCLFTYDDDVIVWN